MSSQQNPQSLPPSAALMQLSVGQYVTEAIYVAAKLGVADHLKAGSLSVDQLATAVGAHSGALYRLLRALASVGVFTEVEPRKFALTPMGACLQTGVPDSLRAVMLMSEIEREAWGQLEHSIRTGETAFDHVHGVALFAYLQKHPDQGRVFDEAMTSFVSQNSAAVVASYDFSTFSKVVDVGGGHGALMIAILKSSKRTSGVIFDQPSVVDGAQRAIEAADLTDRCECVGGDFFASVPTGGDACIMASVVQCGRPPEWDRGPAGFLGLGCRAIEATQAIRTRNTRPLCSACDRR